MKALVTGGAGFIGRWLAKRLVKEGWETTVLDNLSNGSEKNLKEFREKIEFAKGDIRNKALIAKLFEKKPDVCFHLAAEIHVQNSIENPRETIDVNINGTFNILEAAKQAGTKVAFISSAHVYSSMENRPIDETHPTWPDSPYTASKIAGENIALSYYFSYNLPVVVARPFTAYGPFQRSDTEGGVTGIFLKRFLEKKDLEVFGSGEQSRDLFYVEDCADFLFKAGTSEKAIGQIINAGSGKEITINQLALKICKDKSMIRHVKHPREQAEIERMACDFTKAESLLGWKPKTSLETGLKLTSEWLEKSH